MRDLLPTLLEYDPGMLAIIAHRWDVDIAQLDKREAAEALAAAMLDPARAEQEWKRLTDAERGALQTLLSARDHKMPEAQFSRFFGEIRQMGPGRRDREKPHLHPASVAEALYYRGLLATAYDQARTGGQLFAYVPADLAAVLPTHATGYDLDAGAAALPHERGQFEPQTVQPATTTLVDDLTTLLAYLQLVPTPSDKAGLFGQIAEDLTDRWLGEAHPARTALLVTLAGSLGLAASERGIFKPVPSNARTWLERTRPQQVRALAEGWRASTLFNDLWHTPGLKPEDTGWRNDPLLARQTVLTFLEMVPPDDWWPVARFIEMVKADEPDFQRPAGDYESWYIRDAATGEYLRGFESWDRVDGAVLWFILTGPMHWLGLTDLGDEGALCRLTVYGRALVGAADWPDRPEEREHITIQPDGTILASRTVSRYERFQLARITEWGPAGDPYVYYLTASGLQRATAQGIGPDVIRPFLKRASGAELPASIHRLLEQWERGGGTEARLTRAVVLRIASEETMKFVTETPELRRYLGAQLGPTAVLVRPGQEDALASALQAHGILVTFDEA